jgi:D-sedoheptulose 7-phosphate isomerase
MEYLLEKRLEQFKNTVESIEITNTENIEFSLEDDLTEIHKLLVDVQKRERNLYIIGNGGSAAIASHAVIDFMNVGKISAHTLHDPSTLTCMSNDYGYENAFSKILNITLKKEDLLIVISSSGKSKNMTNAVKAAKKNGTTVITLSGFDSKNTLRTLGDINIWINSRDYGMVEIAHQFILHNLADRFIDKQVSL